MTVRVFTRSKLGGQMSTWSIAKTVRILGRKILPGKRVHPHLFRHSLAMALANKGAHILTIKDQLGHSNIATTMIYLNSAFTRREHEYSLAMG